MEPRRKAMMAGLADLELFAKIIEAGNLSAAARALSSSPAAMSRALSSLESKLGVRLVTRTSRSFQLTEEGAQLYERARMPLLEIAEAVEEASSKTAVVKGKLRVGAPNEIGRRLIAPLIAKFVRRYPEVEIQLVLGDSGFDVIADALDIALRVGLPDDSSIVTRRILSTKRIVCASPAYFRRYGVPSRPEDLQRHECIRLVRGKRIMDSWLFQENKREYEVKVSGKLLTTSGEVIHDWIRAGRGIGLKATWDLLSDLAEGAIVPCLEEFWCDQIDLFALCAARTHQPPRIRIFVDFIARNLRSASHPTS